MIVNICTLSLHFPFGVGNIIDINLSSRNSKNSGITLSKLTGGNVLIGFYSFYIVVLLSIKEWEEEYLA